MTSDLSSHQGADRASFLRAICRNLEGALVIKHGWEIPDTGLDHMSPRFPKPAVEDLKGNGVRLFQRNRKQWTVTYVEILTNLCHPIPEGNTLRAVSARKMNKSNTTRVSTAV